MHPTHPSKQQGFSIVELMVAVVVGLLAVTFATRLMINGEQSKAASVGGSDAMQNGMLALFSINTDASQAGWGLNDDLVSGCNTRMTDTEGFALAPAVRDGAAITPLAPAVIADGGTGSDTLTLYSGSGLAGVGSTRVSDSYLGGATIKVDTAAPFGFNQGDVIVVAAEPSGADCALAQLSATPDDSILQIAAGSGWRFNTGNLGLLYNAGQARVFNLGPAGKLSFHTWSVANGVLRLRATDLAGTGAQPQAVVGNVVALKAQYGFDTRAGTAFVPKDGMQVGRWSSAMIDADGDGSTGAPGDWQRIAALRIAIVARGAVPERPAARQTTCTATTAPLTVFGTAVPAGVAASPAQVALGIPNDAVSWTCYRYRVFETIVPIRNAGWRP
ncbi:PilW family protein [Pseudoduganella umbonata]|uniref:Prepilin-type N-terminal cleavage/methylation domain-containing protein n=2 Tax=Pseudoduganella umbonata TaxID=864828 RepID=A0A4P8HLF8_9BURK|nr:PilW family protein [Pseudoduganella umbonata]MBB3221384.1 type IV pilus assembly protein PilW [Pseudoduganella umbonata]QCP10543.1 prepilin-type N-terminal cleavage/methylation domain-containing protein [Pseudoduganella umbonata]